VISPPGAVAIFAEASRALGRSDTPPPLGVDLDARFAAARVAWPELAVDLATYVRHLAVLAAPELPPLAHAADVYLACACLGGDAAALAAFARSFDGAMAQAIARVDSSAAFRDEVLQIVREKLFVPQGPRPALIREYGGRAPLASWLRVVAKRAALSAVRGAQRHKTGRAAPDEAAVLATETAPELAYLKATYRERFEVAAREAFGALTSRERTLLRLHLTEQMTLAQLGAMYDVSHSTVARWITAARDGLVKRARRCLHERYALSPSEIDSVAGLLRSEIDVRVADLLRSTLEK
jgi:RNA polymerase sigma-70 factor (ECF subfamily)